MGGAILLLAGDVRIGKRGPKFKFGMNEVAIGMMVPIFGMELARHKMPAAYLSRATTQGTVFTADEAVKVGYLDVCVDEADFLSTCMVEAERVAKLKNPGFKGTKMYERGAIAEHVKATLARDAERLCISQRKLEAGL